MKSSLAQLLRRYERTATLYVRTRQVRDTLAGDTLNFYTSARIRLAKLPKVTGADHTYAASVVQMLKHGMVVESSEQMFLGLNRSIGLADTESILKFGSEYYRVKELRKIEEYGAYVIKGVETPGDDIQINLEENVFNPFNTSTGASHD
jgi:hypothetical protein